MVIYSKNFYESVVLWFFERWKNGIFYISLVYIICMRIVILVDVYIFN